MTKGSLNRLLGCVFALGLAACATPSDDPHPPITPSDRASLLNECAKIADRGDRERCLEQAAFAREW